MRKGSKLVNVDRLPPHSAEAECGLLGCLLLDPKTTLAECMERLKTGQQTFYELKHQLIYARLIEMYARGDHIDVVTLQQRLRDNGELDQVGGLTYVSTLCDYPPSAANLAHYLEIVIEKYTLRRMIAACTQITSEAFEFAGDIQPFVDGAQKRLMDVAAIRLKSGGLTMSELVSRSLQDMDRLATGGRPHGLPTGFAGLDNLCCGLSSEDYFVIAARTSVGKTSLAMNIAEHVGVHMGYPVGILSMEMTATQLTSRLLSSRARVDSERIRKGILNDWEMKNLVATGKELSAAPFFIEDEKGLNLLQVKSKARRLRAEHGIRLLIIDYIQLIQSHSNWESRASEVAEISVGIKGLTGELGIPIIVLSQLNRESDKQKGRMPRLSDLKESSAIEQDADQVLLLWRPNEDGGEDTVLSDADGEYIKVQAILAKNRNGRTGRFTLRFYGANTRFQDMPKTA